MTYVFSESSAKESCKKREVINQIISCFGDTTRMKDIMSALDII